MTSEPANSDLLVFNGINVDSGNYLLPPLSVEDVSAIAQGKTIDKERLELLQLRKERADGAAMGVVDKIDDPSDLAQTGWGIIFPGDLDPAPYLDALRPLLDLRKDQARKNGKEHYYQEYTGADGVFTDQSALDWLVEHDAGPGPADPDNVPYYLLIVGSPEHISFEFQYDLDVQYGVGRLHFDTLEDYASYARTIVAAETGKIALPRQARFFATANHDDDATRLSESQLIEPLLNELSGDSAIRSLNWKLESIVKEDAKKERLGRLLGGAETPALLFTASHGAGFLDFSDSLKRERQLRHQGALVCQDWPGPESWRGTLKDEFYFSGDNVSDSANLAGMIAFLFACFGAGTPLLDDFSHKISITAEPEPIASKPFVARLPQRLLSHPRGTALAVVGHVERATGYSFSWPEAAEQTAVFSSALRRIMRGQRVGWALEYFNQRYAELSTNLSQLQTKIARGRKPDNALLTRIWTANNDARSYIVLGDPAARLPIAATAESAPFAFEEPVRLSSAAPAGPAATNGQPASPPSPPANGAQPNAEAPVSQPSADTASVQLDVTVRAPGAADTQAAAFGLFEKLTGGGQHDEAGESLRQSLQRFSQQLVQKLGDLLDDVTTLEVATYVSDDLQQVEYQPDTKNFTNATPRALTRISFDGDTVVCVPRAEGEIDQGLWKIHTDMVQQAQAARNELLKTLLGAATGMINVRG